MALRALARVARTGVGAHAIYRVLHADLRIFELQALDDDLRGEVPLDTLPLKAREPRAGAGESHPVPSARSWPRTTEALTRAYATGDTTPLEVARRATAAARRLADRRPSVGPILDFCEADATRDAQLATDRYRDGCPRGPLDGVPVVVKEEMSVRGLPRRSGTRFEDPSPRAEDGTVVRRLREAGAVVLGTTPMTEYGMTPTGANPHRVMPRNPHATDRLAGGSSTGSGVAVATGIAPIALGCDGGGSIRIPAAVNGVFGIKPTWGRVSRWGDSVAGSVSHIGPLGASSLDLACILDVIAGPDPLDPQTLSQPAMGPLLAAIRRGVRGLVIGLPEGEWREADGSVTSACRDALRALERAGAKVVPVEIEGLRHVPAIGYLIIGVESRALLRAPFRDHADDMGWDLQIALSALGHVSASEYADGMRLRAGLRKQMARAFEGIDVLALPTLPQTVSRVTDAEMASGFLDPKAIAAACRYNFLANLTGHPALSCPVGLDQERLPIGLQLLGDAWDEPTLLAASAELERAGAAGATRPTVFVDLLQRDESTPSPPFVSSRLPVSR
jgi:Asp-tRNA(Asn)/Glu-tRNA(Gln) amidotransferase A subunit family amidase